MGKFMLFFLPSLKANYWQQLQKVFFEDVDDKTPTSMEKNFSHRSENTTITSRLLWDSPTVKDMDILFHALSIAFMVQTRKYLQMQAEESLA